MTMPTDNRATAERIAPFTLADADRYTKRNSTTFEQDIVDAVNEDRKHRHRTVERDDITDERMRAAWDEAYRRVKPPAPKAEWPAHHPASIAWHREFIAAFHGLAAEFDAGERVTLSDGSVVTRHPTDAECPWRRDYTNSTTRPPRITNATQWSDLFMPTDTGADFDAVKRLAEQRGAER